MKQPLVLLVAWLAAATVTAGEPGAVIPPVPFRVGAKMPEAAEVLSPAAVRLEGWLGARIEANEKNRLLKVDTEPLLAGYRKKPGSHPWIGEHVGKWLHAATLAWANTGDPVLRAKLDRVAAELIQTQEPDGYLGTYTPDKRFGLYQGADWDVWSHKYNLIGLLTYYQYTGNVDALNACRKVGDLLIATFPARKSIIAAGTHVGMAATSVLEPVVLLYEFTGDDRYLRFARYIVGSWDEPNGPKIIAALLREKQVNKTANGKAYEMLSNLVGLCELARATGDRSLLEPVTIAWEDIVAKRLYLTGSASAGEHFQADHVLPNQPGAHICETCVTVTWIQLNLQLLRLTGQARYGHELERTFYNHLAAAQHPAGADWCYYTALEGRKPYDSGINCCHSSGPRGMALAPQSAYLKLRQDGQDVLAVSTLETSSARLQLGGQATTILQQSGFPRSNESTLTLRTAGPLRAGLLWRVPAWAGPLKMELNGESLKASVRDGWATVSAREWKDGDRLTVHFNYSPRVVLGTFGNQGRAALAWGPFVLAYEDSDNPGLPPSSALSLVEADPMLRLKDGAGLLFEAAVVTRRSPEPKKARLVTFADAGAGGGTYRVWLRAPGAERPGTESLLLDGAESRSREGNQVGSINDGDYGSIVVTFNGERAAEDWFAVTMNEPISFRKVVFSHGRSFHDGGWFDCAAGKPRVQAQREKGGVWENVGELSEYPSTSSTDDKGLKAGQKFTRRLAAPVQAWGLRIVGAPAGGDNPNQGFSSCAELEAFTE